MEQPQGYVVGFLRLTGVSTDHRDRILLLRKGKPRWQKGLLNGVGGKMNFSSLTGPAYLNETPIQAMNREWMEETLGAGAIDWKQFAELTFMNEAKVHFFKAQSNAEEFFDLHGTKNDVGERFEVQPLDHVLRRDDIIPNLKWLLPLAFLDTCDQVVHVQQVERGTP